MQFEDKRKKHLIIVTLSAVLIALLLIPEGQKQTGKQLVRIDLEKAQESNIRYFTSSSYKGHKKIIDKNLKSDLEKYDKLMQLNL